MNADDEGEAQVRVTMIHLSDLIVETAAEWAVLGLDPERDLTHGDWPVS